LIKRHLYDTVKAVGEFPIPIVEALPTTKTPKYIWLPFSAWLLSTVDW